MSSISKQFVTGYRSRNIVANRITISDTIPVYEEYDLGSNQNVCNIRFKFNKNSITSSGAEQVVVLRAMDATSTTSYDIYYQVDIDTIFFDPGVAVGGVLIAGWNVIEVQINALGNDRLWINGVLVSDNPSIALNVRYIDFGAISINSGISGSYLIDEIVVDDSVIGLTPFEPYAKSSVPKLAQVFSVYSQYTPTKASAYIKPVYKSISNAFDVNIVNSDFVTGGGCWDALNFSSISQTTDGFLVVNEVDSGFSSDTKGFLSLIHKYDISDYPIVYYPIQSSSTGIYNLWIRGQGLVGLFEVQIYLDGHRVDTITSYALTGTSWNWYSTTINISDTSVHSLGIKLTQGNSINKVFLSKTLFAPVGEGPDITQTPFQTIHSQLYTVDVNGKPVLPLFIYDNKTTLSEVKQNDWYNFSLRFLGNDGSISFDDRYALVLFSVGGDEYKYILWETALNNEYICENSAVKY
jgi:hypothetical protein